MTPADLRDRITDHFSDHADRADVWRGFDLVLNTDSFLNLGYSRWYQPHFIGSSQLRLAAKVGDHLDSRLRETEGRPLLDVGCGRGGPAIQLSNRFGFDVTGIDLVPYNVHRATHQARTKDINAQFVVGEATTLPFTTNSMAACTAIDSLVYVPDRPRALSEIATVLVSDGILLISDLLLGSTGREQYPREVATFADVWDMPSVGTVEEYTQMLENAGFDIRTIEDLTANSVGRFRKWTTLFLGLLASPARPLVARVLRWYGLDLSTLLTQIRAAHRALPHLRHVLFVGRTEEFANRRPPSFRDRESPFQSTRISRP